MRNKRTLWIILGALLAVASVGAIVLKNRAGPDSQLAPATASTTAPPSMEFLASDVIAVAPHELRHVLPLSGSLRAVNQVSVKARLAAEVREVLVREGEAVKVSQILIKMDASEYQARMEQAKGALQAARAQRDIAIKARDNNRALLAKGFISQNAFDNTASQVDIAEANVESATGALNVAQKALGDTVIRAPIAGMVSSRSVQPGEKVSADNRLLDVVDLRQMEMEAAVPTSDVLSIVQGQDVQVTVEGLPQPLPGKVVRINPATQAGSRSILVYIQVDNPQGLLRAGMFAEAQLTLAKKNHVLTVPQTAIQNEAGTPTVYAIENGKLVQRPVALGIKGDDGQAAAVEIVSGLDNGAQIVKTNLGTLRPGTLVRFSKAASVPDTSIKPNH